MSFNDALSPLNISASGLAAERLRMEVVAHNIANAQSTRSPGGGPYRRQDVLFAAVLNDQVHKGSAAPLGGVEVVKIVEDPSDFIKVYQPGHPDADRDGMVAYPNVQLPLEMTNLITASRAYEANVKAAQMYRQMLEQSLTLMRG